MNPTQPTTPRTVEAVAAQWLARKDRGLTAAEQDEYLQWLRQDAAHGPALARLEKTWGALDHLSQWRPAHSPQPNPDLLAAPPRRRRWLPVAVFAAAAAITVSVALWTTRPTAAPGYERRSLPDGSVVELNRGARVEEHFTAAERRVELVQGEANFIVAKNPARPFVVHAGKVAVRAVGTVFNVRLQHDSVEVIVSEGKVRVERPALPAPVAETAPLLVAGQRALIATADAAAPSVVADLTPRELAAALAWRPQRLDFPDLSLAEVVAEFNRHNRQQIVIGDPELAGMRVGGNFRTDNVDAFVRLLEASFGIKAVPAGDHELVLRRPDPSD